MGFNVSVHSQDQQEDIIHELIDRTYYSYVCNYENEGAESVIQQTGTALGIDLKPLATLVYLDEADDEYIESNLQNTEELLNFVTAIKEKLSESPMVFSDFVFKHTEDAKRWPLYFSSGEILKHLNIIIRSLQQYQQADVKQVFFGVL